MALTPKQEKFCQCIVSGMSKKDSYFAAYDCTNERVASNEANILLQRDDITKRIEELRKPLINHARNTAISERERIKSILWQRLELAIANNDDATIVKYTDQINRMNAEYINVNRNIDDSNNDLHDMDTKTLLKLVE